MWCNSYRSGNWSCWLVGVACMHVSCFLADWQTLLSSYKHLGMVYRILHMLLSLLARFSLWVYREGYSCTVWRNHMLQHSQHFSCYYSCQSHTVYFTEAFGDGCWQLFGTWFRDGLLPSFFAAGSVMGCCFFSLKTKLCGVFFLVFCCFIFMWRCLF